MSLIKRMFWCPCRERACLMMRAQRALLLLIAVTVIAAEALILTGAMTVTFHAEKPAATSTAMLMPAVRAAAQLEPTSITTVAAVTVTPAQEWAACTAAASLRAHQVQHARVSSSAWWSVWRAGSHADAELRHLIHAWMRTGRGWVPVHAACNPDEGI